MSNEVELKRVYKAIIETIKARKSRGQESELERIKLKKVNKELEALGFIRKEGGASVKWWNREVLND